MEKPSFLRAASLTLSVVATVGGGVGFVGRGLAFLNQANAELLVKDAVAWAAIAIVFGAGLISLAILATKKP